MSTSQTLFAAQALLPDGWARNVAIKVKDGYIASVAADARKAKGATVAGIVIPGMPNLHSHAFQRAMAGMAERAGGKSGAAGDDTFWTWRKTMYRFASRLDPDQVEAVAAQLYAELLCQGYTSVAEFHYLHNAPDGSRYDDPAEMALRVTRAAETAGIGMTLLPVLYARGGFRGEPLTPAQQRFRSDPDSLATVGDAVARQFADLKGLRIGLAIHSLRAAPAEMIREALAVRAEANRNAPVHIHIAEQIGEVTDCVARNGATPVRWLLDNIAVDEHWCLVHATHIAGDEIAGIAARGAAVGLCPTTEANLGDGLFPLREFLARGGRFGIGSDSNISISPVEELRWLEYGQRLLERTRAIAAGAGTPSVGGALWPAALAGGAQALGQPVGAIEAGKRADLLVLDDGHIHLDDRAGDAILDALVFAGNEPLVKRVMAAGDWVVEDGRHRRADEIEARYRTAVKALL